METVTFRPIPCTDRPETAPLLPIEIIVSEAGVVVGHDDCHINYFTLSKACADHQMSATELLGADLTDDAIRKLRSEASDRGDRLMVAHCRAALDGETFGREKVADAIVTARLMDLG